MLSFFSVFFFVKILCWFSPQQGTKQVTIKAMFLMQSVKIYTFNPKNPVNEFDIFVLCKGLNSGKPLEKPCPNCFVVACKNQADKDFYTTLLFGLWKIKHFYPYHTGSVIPFIRISDFKQIVKEQANRVSIKPQDFIEDVHKFKLIERKQKQIYEQMALLNDVKRALIYRHFHSKR